MKKFWAIIITISLICALLIGLTYSVPQIKTLANDLAKDSKTPIWLVGLLAPIIYLFKNLGKSLGSIFLKSEDENNIEKKIEKISKEQDRINNEVARLDQWRNHEIDTQLLEIEKLKITIQNLTAESKIISDEIARIRARDPISFTDDLTDDQIEAKLRWRISNQ